mmetsp:Transcript_20924/g.45884  ORF Transcript_20924/g.45884 Transcript_20924/m.45884 type:complete len:117 (-) Transcript_20924:593-943(-)
MTFLVLLRHGNAVAEQVDPERPLDDEGTMQACMSGLEVGATLTSYGVKQVRLLHSSKLRAKQTAELVAKELTSVSIATTVSEVEGLKPNDDCKHIVSRIKKERPESLNAILLVTLD